MSILREIVTGLLILIFLGGVAIVTIVLIESPTYHTLTIVCCPGYEDSVTNFVTIVPSPGKHSYIENENVIVRIEFKKTHDQNRYLTFDRWSGDATGTTTETTVIMDSNKTIKANFSWGYLGENDYALSGYRLMDLPVSYSVNPENPYGINENRVTAVIKRAFECWDKHTSTELFDNSVKMTEMSHHKLDDLNVVFFDSNIDFQGQAHLWEGGDGIWEFDISLNPKILRRSDMGFKTTLHEVGHALGLGHPKRVGTVMNSPYDTDNGKNLLAPGDIMGLHVLYGE